jgi:plastocyanin
MLKRFTFLACAFTVLLTSGISAKAAVAGDDDAAPGTLTISIRDLCDPLTFNATAPAGLGPGSCIRDDNPVVNGSQTLAGFRFELGQEKSAGAWRFNPARAEVDEGTTLTLINRGGETHTFTRVAKFGGGFVAPLNAVSGNPVIAPECAQRLPNGQLIPQPPSASNIFLSHGQTVTGATIGAGETANFQCCIHPWMRTTLKIEDSDHEGKR